MSYDKEQNRIKVARYRARKRLREQGLTESQIAQELVLLNLGAGLPGPRAVTAPRAVNRKPQGQEPIEEFGIRVCGQDIPVWASIGAFAAAVVTVVVVPAWLASRG